MSDALPLLCTRVEDLSDLPIPGSTRTPCDECRVDVWISPSAARWISRGEVVPVCDRCMRAMSSTEVPRC